ncbi:hypothetical protein [Noviherbaspirillum sp.]|uniref:hypothetical protein n=1 Tax=Noviherbaspirillum sp. TaxID=1926288 RepID=UPI002B497B2B|nr:hypothetical protein [Noviherbaspirillum sp.]HJV80279.1 hypothetical protein [Noviherbaspirillum sp.]
MIRAAGREEELNFVSSTEVRPGDVFVIETPGGGYVAPARDVKTEAQLVAMLEGSTRQRVQAVPRPTAALLAHCSRTRSSTSIR